MELWFAFEDYKLYFLAHESSQWWKNIAKTARVEVEVSEILFEGKGRIVQDKLDHILADHCSSSRSRRLAMMRTLHLSASRAPSGDRNRKSR